MKAIIRGTGSYLPEKVLTNEDLERMVDTSDEWITTRTGIKERRICPENMASSDMGERACRAALENAGISPGDVDGIITATITPDVFFPSTACLIQQKLEIDDIPCFDISAACSGFVYGLEIARTLLSGGAYRTLLVVATECMSRITDYTDRGTCVLLGDGAGGAVVEAVDDEEGGILGSYLSASGKYERLLYMPGGGSRCPATHDSVEKRLHYMKMEGNALFRVAIQAMADSVRAVLKKFDVKKDDVAMVVPHQANLRIIKGVARNLGIPMERFMVNIHKYGNMSAACVPIALDECAREGRIRKNDYVVTASFGGGLTWGSNLIQWTK